MDKESNKIPVHLGVIIDGNRRWAKEKFLPALEGHRRGLNNLERIGEYALEKGIKFFTAFCFSSENWNRSEKEVNYLMKLFSHSLREKNIQKYHKKGIKIRIIGQRERLSKDIREKIEKAEELTRNNQKGVINLAVSYGGRPELVQAVKNIIKQGIAPEKITEEVIDQNLWTSGEPYPDLIIRTGGEQRLSNFLTWQSAYSELYFIKKYWPDFSKKDLDDAINQYSLRQRRFGK